MRHKAGQVKLNVPFTVIVVLVLLATAAGYLYWSASEPTQVGSMKPTGSEVDLRREVSGAGIESIVTYMNPLMRTDQADSMLIFKVALDTHMGDLMSYDLPRLATVRTDEGKTISEGFIWEPDSDSSHHRLGWLKVPAVIEGQPFTTINAAYIELELRDIGIPSRLFRWERGVLNGS